MKSAFAFMLCWLFTSGVHSQVASRVPNDLLEFESATNDSARCEGLIHACFNSSNVNPSAGIAYGKKAIALASANGFDKLLADAHNSIGLCYDTYGKPDSAMFHFETSIELLQKSGFPCNIASVYVNIGNAQRKIVKHTEALASFTRGLEIQEECGEMENRGIVLQSIGSSYNSLKMYEKAIEYFDAALELETQFGMESRLGPIYHSKANSLLGLERLKDASKLFEMAISSYAKSGNEYHTALVFESMAHLQLQLENLDSAIHYSNQALRIFLDMDATTDIVFEQLFLADLLIKNGDHKIAKAKLVEVLPLTISENLPNDRMQVMGLLSEVHAAEGDYKSAYEYQMKHVELKDSLDVDAKKAEMTALVNKFETDKRDKQIALEQAQKAQIQTESDRQKQQKYFYLIGVVLLSMLVLVLINRYLQKQRNALELASAYVRIEQEKERAERSEKMKQQFLSNMSHEIRTPVNAINGLSRLLLDKNHDETTTTFLEAIHHSGEILMVVLNDILDMAKVEAGKLDIINKPMDLNLEMDMLSKMYTEKAGDKGLGFSVFTDPTIPDSLMGDAPRLSQVLGNMISNAIKFTHSGEIEIKAVNVNGTHIRFSIRDTGIGISKIHQQRIFEGFEQVTNAEGKPQGGTGLGLTIAKNLVSLMGGELKVDSERGKGSTFYFSLPILPVEPSPQTNKTTVEPINKPYHIIVAEDNEYNFWVTRGCLEKHLPQSKIYHAKTGIEVLKLLQDDDYDLIIMDVQMPELDGVETTQKLRENNNEIPILGLTASVLKEEEQTCLQAGMNGLVHKPFKDKDFIEALRQILLLSDEPLPLIDNETENNKAAKFLKWMPERLTFLENALKQKDLTTVKKISHQIRPQVLENGMNNLEGSLLAVENAHVWDPSVELEIGKAISIIRTKLNEYSH